MTRTFAADVRWRSLGPATGLTSFLTLALLVGGLALMSPPGHPSRIVNDYAGLIQRTDVAVFLAWQIAVARRIARNAQGGTQHGVPPRPHSNQASSGR